MTSHLLSELGSSLNAAQRSAVEHVEGPLLILAGAGSGKTRVLTLRIARLISVHGVDPSRILAVTFTNKAAGEMAERVWRFVGSRPPGMWVGTFHSIGARLLRIHASAVSRTPAFTIYDAEDSLALAKRVIAAEGIQIGSLNPSAILAAISDAKNRLISVAEYQRLARDAFARTSADVYAAMERALARCNAVTFDDLLTLPVELLIRNPDILRTYRDRFQHVLVDEYQDTNQAQYRLIALLGGGHGNVCVVGDDDQSIYGWRGADVTNILNFSRDFASAHTVRLEENYRSTPRILALANEVISHNEKRHPKRLRATLPDGEAVSLVAARDERDEADWIVDEISARRQRDMSLELRDIAVIYRTNAQSRALEESLRRRTMAYRLVGSVRFYDRREIRDLLAYLKLMANPLDDESFVRAVSVPRRGVGATTIEQLALLARSGGMSLLGAAGDPACTAELRPAARTALREFAALLGRLREQSLTLPLPRLIEAILEAARYGEYLAAEEGDTSDRLDNIRELVASAEQAMEDPDIGDESGSVLDRFLQRVSLLAEIDSLDPDADAVTLMTVHNAKGLEFPVVFIAGLEDGLFPLARAYDDPRLLEEERRLLYVGITRAERKLYLSYAGSRRRAGELKPAAPSSFVRDLPRGLVDETATVLHRGAARATSTRSYVTSSRRTYGVPERRSYPGDEDYSQDEPRFIKGARVRHARFGEGTIADLSGVGRDAKVTVDFDDESVGRKKMVIVYAALENGYDE